MKKDRRLADLVKKAINFLGSSTVKSIQGHSEDDLIELHHSVGRDIRNEFMLWNPEKSPIPEQPADDLSMAVIVAIWKMKN